MLETITGWLRTFPGWEGDLQLDDMDVLPGSNGLYPRGMTELSRREDVLGNLQIRYSWGFLLRRTDADREAAARWLLQLQDWIARQDALGLTPQFGDEPATQRIRAFDGRLHSRQQVGTALYTVGLTVEFTKNYEVK